MRRRNFLRNSAYGVPSFLLLPLLSAGCSKDEDLTPLNSDKKIIVIGAGVAGLAAANYFLSRNIQVTVIEAQDTIGGRIKTDRSTEVPFDLGASWIHGPSKDNPITDLAKQAGLNTFITDDESLVIYDENGLAYDEDITEAAYQDFEKILEELADSANHEQSFADAFYAKYPDRINDPLWNYQLSAYLEFSTGGDISELSARYFYDDEEFKGQDVIITNGYDKLAKYLADGIDIKLNSPVTSIEYSNELILVSTLFEDLEADYVIITIPLGVLKSQTIGFSPELPKNKRDAIAGLSMNAVNKFLCVWDKIFWDTDAQYIGYTAGQKGKFNYFLNVNKFSSANALMTFAFGEYGLQTEQMSDQEVVEAILGHLRSIYGNAVTAPKSMLRTKWMGNPYAKGAYSFVAKGGRSENYNTVAQSVDNKLFFAGEHTHKDYRGTVHGAYLSGRREAQKIADLL